MNSGTYACTTELLSGSVSPTPGTLIRAFLTNRGAEKPPSHGDGIWVPQTTLGFILEKCMFLFRVLFSLSVLSV